MYHCISCGRDFGAGQKTKPAMCPFCWSDGKNIRKRGNGRVVVEPFPSGKEGEGER